MWVFKNVDGGVRRAGDGSRDGVTDQRGGIIGDVCCVGLELSVSSGKAGEVEVVLYPTAPPVMATRYACCVMTGKMQIYIPSRVAFGEVVELGEQR